MNQEIVMKKIKDLEKYEVNFLENGVSRWN